MSSSLHVYLLDPVATRALVGSRDDQLLEVIRDSFQDELDGKDDYFRPEIEQGAPTAYEALRAVIHGGPFSTNEDYAFRYGYAYEQLCSFTGRPLDNACFTPHRGDWLSEVDQGLREVGITAVSVESFGYGGALPTPLPYTHTPSCGEWTSEQIAQALEQLKATKRANDESGHLPFLMPEVMNAVMECLGWMRQAVARPGFGVIGFRF
ncbi:DUF7691 family protein [Nocardia wallacei]|uniref:DUF7691 family protein n=1 Tax=Nocardia wallacei TaxID=480035 RepID=UPI002458CFFD|nr:hypothetical protein [Nocardia wallacei]